MDGKGSEHAFYLGNENSVLPTSHRGSLTYEYQEDEASIHSGRRNPCRDREWHHREG